MTDIIMATANDGDIIYFFNTSIGSEVEDAMTELGYGSREYNLSLLPIQPLLPRTEAGDTPQPLVVELEAITVKQLRDWLEQFPGDFEVWVGDREGLGNEAREAWLLGADAVIIEPTQDKGE